MYSKKDRIQESGVRSQESGDRIQESEYRSQESGVRSQNSESIASHPLPITSHLSPITSPPSPTIHKAGWIVIDSDNIIRNGFVKIESGRITEIGHGKPSGIGHIIHHGPGVILPSLVNAHTHLELCALKGKVPFEKGFQNWVRELLKVREATDIEVLKNAVQQGIKELEKSGCALIGEVSTLGITKEILSHSNLASVWFKEFLGEENPETQKFLNDPLSSTSYPLPLTHYLSIAGHAPHTTSPNLLVRLKNATKKYHLPFSIHLSESEDEIEFLTTGKGLWADFLKERGINFSDWGLPVKSPVAYMKNIGILDDKTIAVHLIHADSDDFEILLRYKVPVCLCLRSNNHLHKRLPNIKGILEAGIKPCLGTDSLASTGSLNLFDEMAFMSYKFPSIPPAKIFEMATINGARALGMENMFGSLIPGKCGAFLYLSANISNHSEIFETLVHIKN